MHTNLNIKYYENVMFYVLVNVCNPSCFSESYNKQGHDLHAHRNRSLLEQV